MNVYKIIMIMKGTYTVKSEKNFIYEIYMFMFGIYLLFILKVAAFTLREMM